MLLDFFGLTQDVTYKKDGQIWLGHGHNYQAKILSLEVQGYMPLYFFCFYDAALIFGSYSATDAKRYQFVYKNDTLHAASCLPRLRKGVPKAIGLFKGDPSLYIEQATEIAKELKSYQGNGFYGYINLLEGQHTASESLKVESSISSRATTIRQWTFKFGVINYIRLDGAGSFVLTKLNVDGLTKKPVIEVEPSQVLTGVYEVTEYPMAMVAKLFEASKMAYYVSCDAQIHYFNYDEDNEILSFLDSGLLYIFKIRLEVENTDMLDIGTVMQLPLTASSYVASKEEVEQFKVDIEIIELMFR